MILIEKMVDESNLRPRPLLLTHVFVVDFLLEVEGTSSTQAEFVHIYMDLLSFDVAVVINNDICLGIGFRVMTIVDPRNWTAP